MALTEYIFNGPRTVILADGRDPKLSWTHHVERSGRGGVDLVAEIGTPVHAPTAGTMNRRPADGGAGNSCRFAHDANPGWADVFSRLSRYAGADGQHYEQGEVIAFTGDAGGVIKHRHRHLLDPNGVRQNPWDHFTAIVPVLNRIMPTVSRKRRRKMDLVWDTDGTGYLGTEDGLMGLASPQVYNLFYRVINSNQGNSPFVNGARPDTFNLAEVGIMRASLRLLTLSANTQVAVPRITKAILDSAADRASA